MDTYTDLSALRDLLGTLPPDISAVTHLWVGSEAAAVAVAARSDNLDEFNREALALAKGHGFTDIAHRGPGADVYFALPDGAERPKGFRVASGSGYCVPHRTTRIGKSVSAALDELASKYSEDNLPSLGYGGFVLVPGASTGMMYRPRHFMAHDASRPILYLASPADVDIAGGVVIDEDMWHKIDRATALELGALYVREAEK